MSCIDESDFKINIDFERFQINVDFDFFFLLRDNFFIIITVVVLVFRFTNIQP